ncbi:MAG: YlbF family regulator [Streptococcaceae bacterium]|jgi:cell fate (sporulation/competence/biofilm development) regulator YmcA (YheA/YmcA/DUF963 family)|nr:YlbF family regulator [Streptococcaceae bacterium]
MTEATRNLSQKILSLSYVKDFQAAEQKLKHEKQLWEDYERMKSFQKEAILYQQIGKQKAYQETSKAAGQLEKRLKNHPVVRDYALKLADVNDLLDYVTHTIEEKVNQSLHEK